MGTVTDHNVVRFGEGGQRPLGAGVVSSMTGLGKPEVEGIEATTKKCLYVGCKDMCGCTGNSVCTGGAWGYGS